MGNKTSSDSKSADEGKGKDKKGASASSSLEVASTIGAASTRAPTGTCAGSGDDNMTHVAGATEMSGSVSEMMPLNDRRERNRQGRQDRGGRVGGDPSDDEGGSSDDDSNDDESSSGDYDDENDEDYDPPDEDDDDDDYESSGSGGDHLSDSTYKQPKATGKAAVRAAVRATPVHQSTVQGVFFDEQRRFWTAQVRVNGKWKSRSFGVRKYGGRDEARRAAEECRLQNDKDNEKAGRHIKSRSKSEITGVGRDNTTARWGSSWYENGKQKKECFSVAGVGEEGAKQEAIKRRQLMETVCRISASYASARMQWVWLVLLMYGFCVSLLCLFRPPPASTARTRSSSTSWPPRMSRASTSTSARTGGWRHGARAGSCTPRPSPSTSTAASRRPTTRPSRVARRRRRAVRRASSSQARGRAATRV
mmetsp:Transcript_18651/g.53400  ORF Transcript_18651/g.53400 Transcript_18651/m.53400 type:complete len:421 (-) Transcript_18651:2089-3351(-)